MKSFIKIMGIVLALMMIATVVIACKEDEKDDPISFETTTEATTTTTVETTTGEYGSNTTPGSTEISWGTLVPLTTTKAGS